MSWTGYVDSIIANSQGNITQATIIGKNGAIWTPKDNSLTQVLNIQQAEATSLATVMATGDHDKVQTGLSQSGVHVGGERYMFLRDLDGDGKVVAAKKTGLGNLTIQATAQAVLIAFTPEDKTPSFGTANKAVDTVAKYMEGSGY